MPAPLKTKLSIQYVPIGKLVPYEKNARIISEKAINKLADSLKSYGFKQPIVVDKDMVVIVGHTRLQAAKQLGLKEVPVTVATDLSPEQVRLYRLADNRTAQETTWDMDVLKVEMSELTGLIDDDQNIAELTGFDGKELDSLIAETEDDTDVVDEADDGDDVKAAKTKSKDGHSKILHSCPSCGYEWHAGDPPPKPSTEKMQKAKKAKPFGKMPADSDE